VVSHGRYVMFHMAEVAVPRQMFRDILRLIARLRAHQRRQHEGGSGQIRQATAAEVRLDEGRATSSSAETRATRRFGCKRARLRSNFAATVRQ
jgi:hypothetical protein